MANPSNPPYFRLTGTAAGSVQVLQHEGDWNSYMVGTATTGTVILYDSSGTAEGTPGLGQMAAFTGAVRDAQPITHVKHGIVAVVSGTVDALIGAG